MLTRVHPDGEPIPGYKLRYRIAAGGYGEVWAVEAPGRIPKAMKFVRGTLDDERADREWQALNQIKRVRHPFLLSVDRIEVVESQLLVVTELADESLKDCYDRHRRSGRRGVPHGDLLRYLGDAAEVLDFLADHHGLQHLDVKPENLLLVADRCKLADFGLVRRLGNAGDSPPGGLTPVYASPEVFDGKPTRHSDQYSLAVVYQQLLTGSAPFAGTTARELARQHLESAPRLDELADAEREVLARALSKDPARRFATCRKLIDALRQAGEATEQDASALPPRASSLETSCSASTEVLPAMRGWVHPPAAHSEPTAAGAGSCGCPRN